MNIKLEKGVNHKAWIFTIVSILVIMILITIHSPQVNNSCSSCDCKQARGITSMFKFNPQPMKGCNENSNINLGIEK
mgnify:CR=1 FL=1